MFELIGKTVIICLVSLFIMFLYEITINRYIKKRYLRKLESIASLISKDVKDKHDEMIKTVNKVNRLSSIEFIEVTGKTDILEFPNIMNHNLKKIKDSLSDTPESQ